MSAMSLLPTIARVKGRWAFTTWLLLRGTSTESGWRAPATGKARRSAPGAGAKAAEAARIATARARRRMVSFDMAADLVAGRGDAADDLDRLQGGRRNGMMDMDGRPAWPWPRGLRDRRRRTMRHAIAQIGDVYRLDLVFRFLGDVAEHQAERADLLGQRELLGVELCHLERGGLDHRRLVGALIGVLVGGQHAHALEQHVGDLVVALPRR